jgi:hypothetical protein
MHTLLGPLGLQAGSPQSHSILHCRGGFSWNRRAPLSRIPWYIAIEGSPALKCLPYMTPLNTRSQEQTWWNTHTNKSNTGTNFHSNSNTNECTVSPHKLEHTLHRNTGSFGMNSTPLNTRPPEQTCWITRMNKSNTGTNVWNGFDPAEHPVTGTNTVKRSHKHTKHRNKFSLAFFTMSDAKMVRRPGCFLFGHSDISSDGKAALRRWFHDSSNHHCVRAFVLNWNASSYFLLGTIQFPHTCGHKPVRLFLSRDFEPLDKCSRHILEPVYGLCMAIRMFEEAGTFFTQPTEVAIRCRSLL